MRTDHFLHDVANPSSRDLKLHFSYLSENLLVSVTQAGNFISITTFELYVQIIWYFRMILLIYLHNKSYWLYYVTFWITKFNSVQHFASLFYEGGFGHKFRKNIVHFSCRDQSFKNYGQTWQANILQIKEPISMLHTNWPYIMDVNITTHKSIAFIKHIRETIFHPSTYYKTSNTLYIYFINHE